jgi:hypothetical protein
MTRTAIALIVWLMSGSAGLAQEQATPQQGRSAPSGSRIFRLEELTSPQIDALDRERTVFILPVGMIEVAVTSAATLKWHVVEKTERRVHRNAPSSAKSLSIVTPYDHRQTAESTLMA